MKELSLNIQSVEGGNPLIPPIETKVSSRTKLPLEVANRILIMAQDQISIAEISKELGIPRYRVRSLVTPLIDTGELQPLRHGSCKLHFPD